MLVLIYMVQLSILSAVSLTKTVETNELIETKHKNFYHQNIEKSKQNILIGKLMKMVQLNAKAKRGSILNSQSKISILAKVKNCMEIKKLCLFRKY